MARLLSFALAAASGIKAFSKVLKNPGSRPASAGAQSRELATIQATRRYMMYVLLPFWFVPGILDWIWHRQTRIETTSGTTESFIHALMMTEVGIPILMGLFLEINAGVFALMIAAALIHEATAFWDVGFAVSRRVVAPREQHTHSLLEVIPLAAISFLACLHPQQFASLFGAGPEKPCFAIRLKRPALPVPYVASILGSVALFIAAPYTEEILRCWAAQRKGLTGTDTPDCARVLFGEAS